MSTIKKPIKYLSNKFLLSEIEKSKQTYICAIDPKYKEFHINAKSVTDASTFKLADLPKHLKHLGRNELIFRIPNMNLIPDEYFIKSKKYQITNRHIKLPVFSHYAFINNTLTEVARACWKAKPGLTITTPDELKTNGEFDPTIGRITDALALSIQKLIKRYSTRPNWSGYSYLDEMQGDALLSLIDRVLRFDESKGDNPFAYMTSIMSNTFTQRLNAEKRQMDMKNEISMAARKTHIGWGPLNDRATGYFNPRVLGIEED